MTLEGRKKGSTTWTTVATGSADESGRYSFTRKPSVNYEYRAIFGGDTSHVGTTSAIGTVTVRQKVTGQWSDNTVKRAQTTKFYGSVSPNHHGQVIYLQRYAD